MTPAELEQIITPAITALGFELVNCAISYVGRQQILRLYVDGPSGQITIDDCTKISRQISSVLDVTAPHKGLYTLEVSSPGLDRALVKLAHYQRFIGSQVQIKLRQDLNGRHKFTGKLLDIKDDQITIAVDTQQFTLALANIEKANLVPDVRFKK